MPRIGYEIIGQDGTPVVVLYSNSVTIDALESFNRILAQRKGPTDTVATLLMLRYPMSNRRDMRIFQIDTEFRDDHSDQHVVRVHWNGACSEWAPVETAGEDKI